MANFCSACGAAVSHEARYCANCGSRLDDMTLPPPGSERPEAERLSDLPDEDCSPEQPEAERLSDLPDEDCSPEQPEAERLSDLPDEDSSPEQPEPHDEKTPAIPPPEKTQWVDDAISSFARTWRQLFNVGPPAQAPAPPPVERPAPTEPEAPAERPLEPPGERNEGGRASKVLKGCGIVVGVVVGLFIVLLILGAIFGEPRDEDGTKTPAPVQETNTEQKEQSAPTPKPEPTAEPKLTATPVPTVTPIPLCKREAESQYIVALAEFMGVIGTSSANAGERFTELGQNPALILTSEWRDGLTLSMGIMLFAAVSISELQAPESLNEVDEVAKRMASQLEDALYLSAAAIDDIDPDKLEQANQIFLELPKLTLEIGDITSRVCGQ